MSGLFYPWEDVIHDPLCRRGLAGPGPLDPLVCARCRVLADMIGVTRHHAITSSQAFETSINRSFPTRAELERRRAA